MYLLPVYIVARIIVAQFYVFYKALVVTEPSESHLLRYDRSIELAHRCPCSRCTILISHSHALIISGSRFVVTKGTRPYALCHSLDCRRGCVD